MRRKWLGTSSSAFATRPLASATGAAGSSSVCIGASSSLLLTACAQPSATRLPQLHFLQGRHNSARRRRRTCLVSGLHHHHHHHQHHHQTQPRLRLQQNEQRRWTATFRAVIKLVRHGESMANTGDMSHLEVGDHNIPLTARGRRQARRAGERIGPAFIDDSLVFCSPYRRAQQTLEEILVGGGALEQPGQLDDLELRACEEDEEDVESGSNNVSMGRELKARDHRRADGKVGVSGIVTNGTINATQEFLDRVPRPYRIREDPRLREVDHGYEDLQAQEAKREKHGWFYYRFNGGESPADCYDRTSIFMESLIRQVERKSSREQKPVKVLIVSHGLTIRCFVMRYLHLRVADMETVANPHNCDIITLALKDDLRDEFGESSWLFSTGRWGVHGLRKRAKNNGPSITDHLTSADSSS